MGTSEHNWSPHNEGCEKFRLISGADEIALNAEMGLYREFEVTDGVIHGCPGLEVFNETMTNPEHPRYYNGSLSTLLTSLKETQVMIVLQPVLHQQPPERQQQQDQLERLQHHQQHH